MKYTRQKVTDLLTGKPVMTYTLEPDGFQIKAGLLGVTIGSRVLHTREDIKNYGEEVDAAMTPKVGELPAANPRFVVGDIEKEYFLLTRSEFEDFAKLLGDAWTEHLKIKKGQEIRKPWENR